MALYRMDHRARFRDKYFNDVIDQLQLMNKTRFTLNGGSGTVRMGGWVSFGEYYKSSDYNYYCPAAQETKDGVFGIFFHHLYLRREALPEWGSSLSDMRDASIRASNIRYGNRGGYWDTEYENAGWGGWDGLGVSTEDLTTGGSYRFDSTESEGWQTADVLDPYHPVTDPYPGGGAAGYTAWDSSNWDYSQGYWNLECTEGHPTGWVRSLGPPLDGLDWGSWDNSGGRAGVFPTEPTDTLSPSNFVQAGVGGASFSVNASPVGFMYLLKSIPKNAIITKAMIPVKLTDFLQTVTTISTSVGFNESNFTYNLGQPPENFLPVWDTVVTDSSPTPSTSGSVGFALMSRYKSGQRTEVGTGRIKRVTNWDTVGTVAGLSVSSNSWAVVDVTDLCQAFLTVKYDALHLNEFAFFPTVAGAPFNGSAKGWLAGLARKPESAIIENPHWFEGSGYPDAKNHILPSVAAQSIYQDYGPYHPTEDGETLSWGSLAFGEGVIEWQLPSSENGRSVTYRNIVRGDSPVVV